MDIASYRLHERVASAALPNWRIKAVQNPHVFQTVGFPVRVDSTDELISLLDTMQENRFPLFMKELCGLDREDLTTLVDALVDYCLFFRNNFAAAEAPLPLSTMIAHLALAKKLRALEGPARILEIGPGCGYLSFFLKNWDHLEDYAQVETTESFYVLQNLVNRHLFGHRFQDYARISDNAVAMPIMQELGVHATEISPRIRVDLPTVCRHFPWWQLGRVAKERFNVVTTNASLTEFSDGAFRQYAWLIDQCLAPDGCLLVQCHGGGPGSLENILRTFFGIKLAPVALVVHPAVTMSDKFFATSNFLFVREQHPLFLKYAQATQLPTFDPTDVLARAVYGVGNTPRRDVSPEEIVAMVTQKLACHAARPHHDPVMLRSIA